MNLQNNRGQSGAIPDARQALTQCAELSRYPTGSCQLSLGAKAAEHGAPEEGLIFGDT